MTEDLQLIPDGAEVVLPPYGFVHLQAQYASDLDVVNAARVSFAKISRWAESPTTNLPGGILKEDDEKVLRYLLANRHGTPFEHTFFKFHIRAPIFVFREWHRHRIGVSINEESARYSQLQPHFYVPEDKAWRKQEGKPGRYTFKPLEEKEREEAKHDLMNIYDKCYAVYEALMKRGVAKEIARACLPVGIYSQMIWSCNARSLMNSLSLRNAPTALREIRLYAEVLERILQTYMPVTHNAFVENGRVAP